MTAADRPASEGTTTFIVGGGGLLGSALGRSAHARGDHLVTPAVRWSDPPAARADLRREVSRLFDRPEQAGGPWRVAWCAGAGVAGTSDDELAAEIAALEAVLGAIRDRVAGQPELAGRGAVFVASSVGGLYAGSENPPFTEQHALAPTSAYGRAKLAGEHAAERFAGATGVPTVIGRITNLYGPGQDLDKPQGLISHLSRAHLTRKSVSVYVSLDTIRDYLFVDDCADMICDALDGVAAVAEPGRPVVKILGAHQGVTIGALLGEFRRVFKRSPLVLVGSSDAARYQAADLRVRSVVWPELDRRTLTSLPAGLAATAEDLFRTVKGAS